MTFATKLKSERERLPRKKQMTTRTLKQYLNEAAENDVWTVTLKTGEEVVCKASPAKDCMEVAYQQTLARETVTRGDIIYPREIRDMDNQ